MKVRVTLITENDKPVPDNVTDEQMEIATKYGWEVLLNMLKDQGEIAYVEKCELIER